MRPPFRSLLGALAAVVAAGTLAGCNTSPYAASVNGTLIKQTALNQEIVYGDQSPAYVQLLENISQQVTNTPVLFTGDGSGSHSTQWSALELTNLVEAQVIHQAVAARGIQPGANLLDAARGVLEAAMGPTGFAGVPAAYRDQLVQRLAEHAALEQSAPGVSTNTAAAQLQQVYQQHLADFYRQVCVRQISVSVDATNGTVDFQASLIAADQIVSDYGTGGLSRALSAQVTGGNVTCYSQANLESLGTGFLTTVMGLAPGQAARPQQTSFGYNVVAVLSRDTEPFAGPVNQAFEALILELEPAADPPVLALERQARVQVDPAYGTWDAGAPGGAAPGISPPSAPAKAPGAPATSVPSYDPFAPTS